MSEKKDEHVPAHLPDVLAAIELLHTGGAHHRYYDEVCNAVAEIERLRAEKERLREAVDFAVNWVNGLPYNGSDYPCHRRASANDIAAFMSAIRGRSTP